MVGESWSVRRQPTQAELGHADGLLLVWLCILMLFTLVNYPPMSGKRSHGKIALVSVYFKATVLLLESRF